MTGFPHSRRGAVSVQGADDPASGGASIGRVTTGARSLDCGIKTLLWMGTCRVKDAGTCSTIASLVGKAHVAPTGSGMGG